MKILFALLIAFSLYACSDKKYEDKLPKPLKVSTDNPHLLETVTGKPMFINNFTIWKLIEHGTRETIHDIISACKKNKYNMISFMILGISEWEGRTYETGITPYGTHAFETDENGFHNPLRPIVTPGNDPGTKGEYDYWDHVEYAIDLAAENGMYVSVHPAWGNWFQGYVHGMKGDDVTIFDDHSAYQYGNWLGQRFEDKKNVVWMLGGDRSAVNDHRTKWYEADSIQDFRSLYHAMAEGLADGRNGVNLHDGKADYSSIVISYHPRKWAPNSSDWFHEADWLTFNSIQDTPVDILLAIEKDYQLQPVKPTWLYEGRYEEAIHTWGVRYQAYHSVFAGAFGHTYGSDIWELAENWRDLLDLPGNRQMGYLYTIVREIWTDKEYGNRLPDQTILTSRQGRIYGRGIFGVDDFENKRNIHHESSDLISAIRGKDGRWAMVYTANGGEFELNLSVLSKLPIDAYWFSPRNGKWWVDGSEEEKMTPFARKIDTKSKTQKFTAPGEPGPDNDWVLVLK